MEDLKAGYEVKELIVAFSVAQLNSQLEMRKRELEAEGCEFLKFESTGAKSGNLHVWVPEGYTIKTWKDKKGPVIFWLILFNPIGLYGALKGAAFGLAGKKVIAALCLIFYVWGIHDIYTKNSVASSHGFSSHAEYLEAKKHGITSGREYAKHLSEQQQIKEKLYPTTINNDKLIPKSRDLGDAAMIACKALIKRQLTNPSSADFPQPDEYIITRMGEGQTYAIKSYVEAENQYGATVRQNWFCQVTHDNSDGTNINSWIPEVARFY